jgi:hypothetical protein
MEGENTSFLKMISGELSIWLKYFAIKKPRHA